MLCTKTTAICWGNSLTHILENYLVIWRVEQPSPHPIFFLFFLINQSSFILMRNTSLAPPGITVHISKRLQMHIFLWDFPTNLSVQTNHWSIRASQHKASQQMHLSIAFSASPRLANKVSWLLRRREEVQMLADRGDELRRHTKPDSFSPPPRRCIKERTRSATNKCTLAPFEFLHFLLCCKDFHAISCLRATQSSIWEWEGNSTNLWKPVRVLFFFVLRTRWNRVSFFILQVCIYV